MMETTSELHLAKQETEEQISDQKIEELNLVRKALEKARAREYGDPSEPSVLRGFSD